MARPWEPEHVVEPDEARRLIDEACPDLAPTRVERYGAGWDNTVYLVNDEIVFRFPRRAIAVPLIERELQLLPAIAARVPLPVPLPRWSGGPTSTYPWRFAGYRHLPGRTATTRWLDEEERARLALPMAGFLRALHEFPADEAAALGAGGDELGRLDVAARTARVRERLAALGREGDARAEAILAAASSVAAPRPPRVLVHGDLYASQILVDEQGRVTGVIDWGDVHLGDAAVDLGGMLGFLPPRAFDALLAAYGGAGEDTLRLARFRALNHALNVAVYARDIGDEALLRESLTALGHVIG